ncbi:MAG: hypothetical protein B6I19_09685 [Bacteroidetes bacterium 4572_114]|nr:MAG: hypothetical protein B6I19_09685 [Bacteroidetes bacterium 4572_114]
MRKIYLTALILFAGAFLEAYACTTAVISGKATPDGRPLLWKHRDTWSVNNKIVQFFDGKYACAGLVNSIDTANQSIWIGYNSEGFAIMNSASYNLNYDTIELNGLEGRLMKIALQACATIDDFEQMIIDMEKPTRLEGNFGVIDANGGAAYFELGNFEYVKYDATDAEDAPNGYIIRTNFSASGEYGDGGGYIRFETISDVFEEALANNTLDYCTILQKGSRNLKHSLLNIDLNSYGNLPENTPTTVFFKDFIPRSGTSSSCVVQGVKPGENPALAAMWSVVGFPLTSVVVPVWLNKKVGLPAVVQFNDDIDDSPLSNYSLILKDNIYAYKLGSHSEYYIDINQVVNADNSGFLQKIIPLENQIISNSEKYFAEWREDDKINIKQMRELYDWIDDTIKNFYQTSFNLSPKEKLHDENTGN